MRMRIKAFITPAVAAFAAVAITAAGAPPAGARETGTPGPSAGAESVAQGRWTKLAGTRGEVDEAAGAPVRLASYSLVFDAGQQHYGYLREGDRFRRTRYREALVAPGERWVAGIPDHRLWRAVRKIDLTDRESGRTHTIALPAPVTSPEWSADGRTLLLTAYRPHRDGSLTIIGFVTVDAADRTARLVHAGPRHRVSDWGIGRSHRFYFAGSADRVMAVRNGPEAGPGKRRIAVYDLDGRQRRVYTGVGTLDEWHTTTPFSPSGRLFGTLLGDSRGNGGGGPIGIVDAETGKIVHRFGRDVRAFAGWYDDEHVIVQRERAGTRIYQRVGLSGGGAVDLIREKLVLGPADYRPHLERVNFVRRD
ncbi:hypothetical protein GCM10010156_22560 [Planobispora rosea]|uniref:Uncharacterized protein n=2 Tax=Planobispora rosea TaxID=35762 RepID=A0A8J3S039_PLARO|nr:hypothetical protein GCM10010156_22560 [Planobispora rosea]GIH84420.1 hypothetical protein Pro02_28280 [Planobispora rosea]